MNEVLNLLVETRSELKAKRHRVDKENMRSTVNPKPRG
jgi:hypothetical protein